MGDAAVLAFFSPYGSRSLDFSVWHSSLGFSWKSSPRGTREAGRALSDKSRRESDIARSCFSRAGIVANSPARVRNPRLSRGVQCPFKLISILLKASRAKFRGPWHARKSPDSRGHHGTSRIWPFWTSKIMLRKVFKLGMDSDYSSPRGSQELHRMWLRLLAEPFSRGPPSVWVGS